MAITIDSLIIRRDDIPTASIDGEVGMMNVEKGKYFSLDAIGSKIWELLKSEKNIKQIVIELVKEYDVDFDTCSNDVLELVKRFVDEGLVNVQ
jgi:hypothetical protein